MSEESHIEDLKEFASAQGLELRDQGLIIDEAAETIAARYDYSPDQMKANFDELIDETEQEIYRVYLKYEREYCEAVLSSLVDDMIATGEVSSLDDVPAALASYYHEFDRFFLSLSQSRKARAGGAFERIIRSLFRRLDYPFDEQKVINGKPDFLMPSEDHYRRNALDCVIFTSKRTLRERWRQVVTEGTRGLGFYLATIDESLSSRQLEEMQAHRIYVVTPRRIAEANYQDDVNVISFKRFFRDHLDPAMDRWRRNGVI